MNTDWEQRRQIEEHLASGDGLSAQEARDLIEDADSGEIAESLMDGLKEALRVQLGFEVIDTTTDDDDGQYCFTLVKASVDDSESVIR